jgi:hypothetical protein
LEWVDWFNHRRIYEHCGDVPPAELVKLAYRDVWRSLTGAMQTCLSVGSCLSGFQTARHKVRLALFQKLPFSRSSYLWQV